MKVHFVAHFVVGKSIMNVDVVFANVQGCLGVV